MQSNQANRFSNATMVIFWAVTVIVIVWVLRFIVAEMPNPLASPQKSSRIATSTTIIAQSPAIPVPAPADAPTAPISHYVEVGKSLISVEVASSEESRQRGLSGRRSMPNGSGMLFIFPDSGMYGFWMKDMKFPLDIVWIDAEKTVIDVSEGVSPSSYPQVFYPPTNVRYVLELNSGDSRAYHIAIGTKLVF